MIQEKFQDIQIKYIFVKAFTWLHPALRETYQGHLVEGAVYRDIYNPKTGNHKVPINGSDGIGFETLVGTSDISEFELIEITPDNILDFNIKEEDLDKLNTWMSTNNADFQQMFYTPATHLDEEVDFSHRASEIVLGLYQINPIKAEILLHIAYCLSELEMTSHKDPADYLRYSDRGLGINIAEALRSLTKYSSHDRKTNEDTADLMVAIDSIVTEMERVSNE